MSRNIPPAAPLIFVGSVEAALSDGSTTKRVPLIASLAIAITLASSLTLRGQTQSAAGTASFEVASVKPSNPTPNTPFGSVPMVMPPVNGRFSATNVPLRLSLRW